MPEHWGIWSTWSKKWCFGIDEPTENGARQALFKKIGKDAYKWRFEARKIPQSKRSDLHMPIDNTATKVITGKVRLSYVKIWEAEPDDNGTLWFSSAILIPKSDKETLRKIKACVDAAIEQGKSNKWGGKIPPNLKKPLRDGDEERPDDEAYAGHYFLNAKNKNRPGIAKPVGKGADGKTKFQEITDTTEVYSGCYAKVSLNFYPFDTKGNRGIGVGLNNVVKVQDGDFLGGRSSVNDDFANEEFDDAGDGDDENWLD
jgi:hypothetical protein